MDEPFISGLPGLLANRLPLNRKERYYTGTVLPMIVASDGFAHLGRFLELCGVPQVSVIADPAFTNIQFFTEYNFRESCVADAQKRSGEPIDGDTPDLVLYIEGEPAVLLCVEAKVFDRPSSGDLSKQLQAQSKLLSVISAGVQTKPDIYQVALLPAGLDPRPQIGEVPVVTWEQVAARYCDVAPAYWIGILNEALNRYGELRSKSTRYNDDELPGHQIVDSWGSGDRTFTWMGRAGGLNGQRLQDDIKSDAWRDREYQVRRSPLPSGRNWFAIESFCKAIDDHAERVTT